MQVNDIDKYLSEVFPPENALDYDNVGLIAGNRDKVVSAILVSLDLTDEFGNLAIAELLGAKDARHLEGSVCGVVYEIDSEEPVTLKDYCRKVANDLKCSGIITINDPQNKVHKVFIQGGAFDEDSVDAVLKEGIDTVVSGEIKHHICVGLGQMGVNTIIAGHSATEQAYLPKMAKLLSEKFPGIDITVNYNNEVSSIL